jgi:DNA-binding transcriptional LysR family regulator
MELRQLRDFVVLAEELHYARAAARLGIDQSPLSRRIKEFEQDLGVLLFARTSRGTQLTPRGQFLLPRARAILKSAEQAREWVRAADPLKEIVRVSLCDDMPRRDLSSVFAALQHSSASVSVRCANGQCMEQMEDVRNELTDVGFGLFVRAAEGLIAEPLWTASACAVLPRDHSLCETEPPTARHLGNSQIGLIERQASDPDLRAQLEVLARHVTQVPDILDAESLKVLLTMVSAGACVGIVGPAQAEMIQREEFAVRPITQPRAQFVVHMIYRKGGTAPPVLQLIEAVRKAGRRLVGEAL